MALKDVLVEVQIALDEAKKRIGPLGVAMGRLNIAERELAQLKVAPDQSDTQVWAYNLLSSLQAVPSEQPPYWLAAVAALSASLWVARTPKVPQVGTASLVVGLAGVGGAVVEQLLAPHPSSKDRVPLDERASKMKADENMRRAQEEADKKDTADIEAKVRKDSEDRAKKRAKDMGIPVAARTPEVFPRPGGGTRIGYWKDGKFVEIPVDQPVTYNGRTGRFDAQATFIPTEATDGAK